MIGHESSLTSDTCAVETLDDDELSLSTEGEVFNIQEHDHHAISPTPDRYVKQKISANGKLAYVVFAGNEVGVFYNWCVFFSFCKTCWISTCFRAAASMAISGLENSRKVFKGYRSYQDAHSAWDGFVSTSRLPRDVAVSLGSGPYPTPPILLTPSRVSAESALPTTPQHVHTYNCSGSLPLPTPHTPRSRRGVSTELGGPSSSTYAGNHIPIALPSSPSTPISMQRRNAAALAVVREEAFRADQEDFWVVFTGMAPGVYQGRWVYLSCISFCIY
jgi:hypothetical protein